MLDVGQHEVWMLWEPQTGGLLRNLCILFSMGCSWERPKGKSFLQWRPSGEEDVTSLFPILPTDQKAPASVIRVPNSIAFRPQLKNPMQLWKGTTAKYSIPWWEQKRCPGLDHEKCPAAGGEAGTVRSVHLWDPVTWHLAKTKAEPGQQRIFPGLHHPASRHWVTGTRGLLLGEGYKI